MKKRTVAATVGGIALAAIAGCTAANAGGSSTQAPAKPAGHNAQAKPSQAPAPAPKPYWHIRGWFSGTGEGNSKPFYLKDGVKTKVIFYYTNNTDGYGGDNFMADLTSQSGDDAQLANDIAVQGGKTTYIYPDMSFGGSHEYHFEVTATGSYHFLIEQKYAGHGPAAPADAAAPAAQAAAPAAPAPAAAAPTAPAAQAPSGLRAVGNGVFASSATSDAFAENVAESYPGHPGVQEVYSPVTNESYAMTYTQLNSSTVQATGGNGALVQFPGGA